MKDGGKQTALPTRPRVPSVGHALSVVVESGARYTEGRWRSTQQPELSLYTDTVTGGPSCETQISGIHSHDALRKSFVKPPCYVFEWHAYLPQLCIAKQFTSLKNDDFDHLHTGSG